jgi:hypothetical protein
MALVMMTMLFMLTEKLRHKVQYPLLSSADIETLLAFFLPRRDATTEEVLLQMQRRHRRRKEAAESHARSRA